MNPSQIKRALVLGARVVCGAVLLSAAWDLVQLARVRSWPRYPAQVAGLAVEGEVELEVPGAAFARMEGVRRLDDAPYTDGNVRIVIPRPAYTSLRFLAQASVAVDPARPSHVRLVTWQETTWLLVAKGIWLAVLAWIARGVAATRWGRDVTWRDGAWQDTVEWAGGSRAPSVVTSSREANTAVGFWSVAIAACGLATVVWATWNWRAHPIEAGSSALGALALTGLVVFTRVGTRSRRVWGDDAGVVDATMLQVTRVPWVAMASFERVNLARDAQRSYDRRSGTGKGRRPADHWTWLLRDAAGTELLRLSDQMEPVGAYRALRDRILAVAPSPPNEDWPAEDDEGDDEEEA
ncbi:MAG: hypothetical protein IPK85_23125 [Gemmatimonadetes bacterium]|nr:hypothetical protein [Gemmatimonadota bacterium]